jgi:CheY-like chemotaxis protein
MSLTYKILWVDDNPTTVASKVNQIKLFLQDEGFNPKITQLETGTKIDAYLSDPLLDLIITDYRIHPRLTGKQLAERIRQLDVMVDIILYSQVTGTDLYAEVGTLDGVYISHRDGLEDKIKDVIRNTIRRTHRVDNMRGIVISEAIDIENQIEEIIVHCYHMREKALAEELLNGNGCSEFGQKISFLNSLLKATEKELNGTVNGKHSKSRKDQAQLLLAELRPLHEAAKKLAKDVCELRNMLAHVECEIDDNGVPILRRLKSGYQDVRIDSDQCKTARRLLMKHASNLCGIKDFISKWHGYQNDR